MIFSQNFFGSKQSPVYLITLASVAGGSIIVFRMFAIL
jgi:hypothetical protein